jgi:hypothetical protein
MNVDYSRRHLRFGWWSLLLFTVLGLGLEILHGFKVSAYLDASNDTRRLMWTLAHAHGTLLALVHVLFGLTIRVAPEMAARSRSLISWCLIGASVLLPGGFFLGGIVFYGGDPGLSVLLVPIGAVVLMIAIFTLARTASSAKDGGTTVVAGGTPRARRK